MAILTAGPIGELLFGCPDCGQAVPVPVRLEEPALAAGTDGRQTIHLALTPDLADLWAHTWTHTHGGTP